MKALEHAVQELEKARAAETAQRRELERLQRLVELYPDLERHVGRWNRVVYMSAAVNVNATHVFFRFNCGCCSDAPFEAWPYIKTEHGEVYSKPACFYVGEQHWIDGARPNEKWRQNMLAHGVSEAAIAQVQARFEADQRRRMEIAAEEGTAVEDPDPFA